MFINSNRLRELRAARQWSQEQLAKLSGLNLRTIQRLESGARISTESLRALAAVFEVPAESLLLGETPPSQQAVFAIRQEFLRGLEFSGVTTRNDFWWFVLAVTMLLALTSLMTEALGTLPLQLASLLVLLPWIAACTRRLRDAGLNPWWQLISLVPVAGLILLLYFLTYPSKTAELTASVSEKASH